MADARLQCIAADAAARGWIIDWHDSDHRTELLVEPTLSNPEQQGFLGFAVAVRLGGRSLAFWAWEAWSGTLIEPWLDHTEDPDIGNEEMFPEVIDLEGCCQLFDRAARRYMALLRRVSLESSGPGTDITDLADLEPLACSKGVSDG